MASQLYIINILTFYVTEDNVDLRNKTFIVIYQLNICLLHTFSDSIKERKLKKKYTKTQSVMKVALEYFLKTIKKRYLVKQN